MAKGHQCISLRPASVARLLGSLRESKWGSSGEGGKALDRGWGAGWRAGRQLHAICLLCSLGPACIYLCFGIFIPTPFSLLRQEAARIVTWPPRGPPRPRHTGPLAVSLRLRGGPSLDSGPSLTFLLALAPNCSYLWGQRVGDGSALVSPCFPGPHPS